MEDVSKPYTVQTKEQKKRYDSNYEKIFGKKKSIIRRSKKKK